MPPYTQTHTHMRACACVQRLDTSWDYNCSIYIVFLIFHVRSTVLLHVHIIGIGVKEGCYLLSIEVPNVLDTGLVYGIAIHTL